MWCVHASVDASICIACNAFFPFSKALFRFCRWAAALVMCNDGKHRNWQNEVKGKEWGFNIRRMCGAYWLEVIHTSGSDSEEAHTKGFAHARYVYTNNIASYVRYACWNEPPSGCRAVFPWFLWIRSKTLCAKAGCIGQSSWGASIQGTFNK